MKKVAIVLGVFAAVACLAFKVGILFVKKYDIGFDVRLKPTATLVTTYKPVTPVFIEMGPEMAIPPTPIPTNTPRPTNTAKLQPAATLNLVQCWKCGDSGWCVEYLVEGKCTTNCDNCLPKSVEPTPVKEPTRTFVPMPTNTRRP